MNLLGIYNAIPTPLVLNRNHITRWYVIFPTHQYIAIIKDRKRYQHTQLKNLCFARKQIYLGGLTWRGGYNQSRNVIESTHRPLLLVPGWVTTRVLSG